MNKVIIVDREKAHRKRFDGRVGNIRYIPGTYSLAEARVIETGLISYYTLSNLENQRLSISNLRYSTELLLNKVESDLLLLLGK